MPAVVFDMDGVIFDSERCIMGCWEEIALQHNLGDIHPLLYACLGVTRETTIRNMLEMMGADFPCEAFLAEVSAMFHARYDGGRLPLKPGVRELLGFLSHKGIPVALASSTREESVRRNLGDAGILDSFTVLICGNMVVRSKPDPEIYLKACQALQLPPPDCYAIEDSFNGIRSASAAGLHTLMVPDLLQPTNEIRSLCEAVLPSLTDVQTYLEGRLC